MLSHLDIIEPAKELAVTVNNIEHFSGCYAGITVIMQSDIVAMARSVHIYAFYKCSKLRMTPSAKTVYLRGGGGCFSL